MTARAASGEFGHETAAAAATHAAVVAIQSLVEALLVALLVALLSFAGAEAHDCGIAIWCERRGSRRVVKTSPSLIRVQIVELIPYLVCVDSCLFTPLKFRGLG